MNIFKMFSLINLKTKVFKFLYSFVYLFLVIGLISCQNFLEVQPRDAVSDDLTITDKNSSENAIRGAYRSLAASGYYGGTFQLDVLMSGNVLSYTQSSAYTNQFLFHTLTPDNNDLETIWSAIYKSINIANHVISKLPNVTDANFTSDSKNQLLGEAYFIRALGYFDLARSWGGVQIYLTPTNTINDKLNVSRSTQAQVYSQVLNDLNTAESLLTLTGIRDRANKRTAQALRARLNLYTGNWATAESDANLVLADANFGLVTPYSSFYGLTNTKESIFELSYSTANINPLYASFKSGGNFIANDSIRYYLTNTVAGIGGTRSGLISIVNGKALVQLYPSSSGINPTYLIRTSELYLIRAEARARQGNNLTGALDDLNLVRVRSGLSKASTTNQDQIINLILKERLVEFAFEPHRWFDLVRTGKANTVLGFTDSFRYLFPIPTPERNADPSLDQNSGY